MSAPSQIVAGQICEMVDEKIVPEAGGPEEKDFPVPELSNSLLLWRAAGPAQSTHLYNELGRRLSRCLRFVPLRVS